MLSSYKKKDPPSNRVKPIPAQVLRRIMAVAHAAPTTPGNLAIAYMCSFTFFYLLRPDECTVPPSESTPFWLCGGSTFPSPPTMPTPIRTTFATLTLCQKNGVRGGVFGLSRSGHPQLFAVISLCNRILDAREHSADLTAPIAHYFDRGRWHDITPTNISTTLKAAITFLGPTLGFLASDVSARYLRAAGAMALLCAHVDTDLIPLVGRWRSDEFLCYLHVQAEPTMRGFSARMLQHGSFVLLPNNDVLYASNCPLSVSIYVPCFMFHVGHAFLPIHDGRCPSSVEALEALPQA
jgi:hypothetical protein